MRKLDVILIILLLALAAGAFADLTCAIQNTACGQATLLYLKNDSGGYDNAHAELPSHSPLDYSYRLCCASSSYIINNSCGTSFLNLSSETNAHVQDPAYGTAPFYPNAACIDAPSNVRCAVKNQSCDSNETCLLSIASSEGDNKTNAHVASCGFYSASVCCRANVPPSVASASISPTVAVTNTTLSCLNGTVSDPDNDPVTLSYDWYNGSQWMGVNNGSLDQSHTLYGQSWNCSITPNDGYGNGTTVFSTAVFIDNTAPGNATLVEPADGNETVFWRNVSFAWTQAYDPDELEGTQSLTYDLNITGETCPDHFVSNVSWNYTLPYDLECVAETYHWRVRATDGMVYGDWSPSSSFVIEPTLILNLTQSSIDFGAMDRGESQDTADDYPFPFIVENLGNINIDTRFYAQAPLWNNASLNTSAFQIKARVNETGAFGLTDPRTSLSYVNVTGTNATQFTYIIGNLSYVDSNDAAAADIKVTSPSDEPAGKKNTSIIFGGEPIVS